MEKDAQFIKDNYEIVLPVQGIVTSRFGNREKTDIISENHEGIDIGATEGTKIVSAIDGKVTLVSEIGEYGNHIKIENRNFTTFYAHCKNVLVSEGEEVRKGDKIAEVGSTGRVTRSTFTFRSYA